MNKPVEFRIVDHGPDHAQYFPGHGVAFTRYTHCATGCGSNGKEALDDALEQLASGGWDVSEIEASDDAKAINANPKTVDDWHECGKTLPDDVEIHADIAGTFYVTQAGKVWGPGDTFATEEEAKKNFLENADDLFDGCEHYWYVSVDVL